MSSCYFMYQNLLSDSGQITLSSARAGVVGMPAAQATGSAMAHAAGDYSGGGDQVFLLEIDSVATGAEVGSATFRWRRADYSNWEQSGVTASATLTTLADGVSVKWVSGIGDDFALGDAWNILAVRPHGAQALIDRDRDQLWLATGVSDEHLTIDLGSAQEVGAMILADHNLSAAATVTLMADTSDSFASPAWSQSLSVSEPHLVCFPDQTYRYWRLALADAASSQEGLEASGLYLGPRFAPSRTFRARYTRSTLAGRRVTTTDAGKMAGHTRGMAESLAIEFSGLSDADVTGFEAMYRAIHDQDSGRLSPLFFTPFSDRPASTLYCLPGPSLGLTQTHQGRWQLGLSLEEVVRTNV